MRFWVQLRGIFLIKAQMYMDGGFDIDSSRVQELVGPAYTLIIEANKPKRSGWKEVLQHTLTDNGGMVWVKRDMSNEIWRWHLLFEWFSDMKRARMTRESDRPATSSHGKYLRYIKKENDSTLRAHSSYVRQDPRRPLFDTRSSQVVVCMLIPTTIAAATWYRKVHYSIPAIAFNAVDNSRCCVGVRIRCSN